MLVGPIPFGMVLDHVCRTPNCVNPAHLRVVTRRQNNLENSLGVGAMNAAKHFCIHGHLFDKANTYIHADGERACRKCGLIAQRKYKVKP